MKTQTPTHFKVIDSNGDIDHKELSKELFSKLTLIFGTIFENQYTNKKSKNQVIDQIYAVASEAYNLHGEMARKGLYS